MTKPYLMKFTLLIALFVSVAVQSQELNDRVHWVQIFSSADPENLKNFLEKHKDIDDLQVQPFNQYSRVVIGPFTSFRQASQTRKDLANSGHLLAFVRTASVKKTTVAEELTVAAVESVTVADTDPAVVEIVSESFIDSASDNKAEMDEPEITLEQIDQLEEPAAGKSSSLIASTPYMNSPAKLADVIAQIHKLDAETRRELLGEYFPQEFSLEADEEIYGINYESD